MTALQPHTHPPLTAMTPDLEALLAQADAHAANALAPATVRGYRADWESFTRFCDLHHLHVLPAATTTVAAYVEDLLTRCKRATVDRHLSAITKAHRLAGYPAPLDDPWLAVVVQGMRRSVPLCTDAKDALLVPELKAMVAALPDSPLGRRDRALLLVGFQGAFRREELVGLDTEDLDFKVAGVILTIRQSKTDRTGTGERVAIPNGHHPATCARTALERWLATAGITTGPVFRPVSRGGRALQSRLTGASVNTVVQRTATLAGITDPSRLGAHSLRAGFVTEATRGAPDHLVARQTRHRRVETMWRYVRDRELLERNAAAVVDL